MIKLKSSRPEIDIRITRCHRMVPVRMSHDEYRLVSAHARRYTGGNISEWIRYVSIHFSPAKKDLLND